VADGVAQAAPFFVRECRKVEVKRRSYHPSRMRSTPRRFSLVVLVLFAALAARPAVAQEKSRANADVKGAFGIGADATLAGLGGVSARYQLMERIGVQSIFAFARESGGMDPMGGAELVDTGVFFALRGDMRLLQLGDVHLAANVGLDLFHTDTRTESDTRFAFEAGAKVEYHPSRYFSLHFEVGLVLALLSGVEQASVLGVGRLGGSESPFYRPMPEATDGNQFIVGLGDTLASVGFTFWLQ
jgi:hypothetical protein